jgi:hypothetical protein
LNDLAQGYDTKTLTVTANRPPFLREQRRAINSLHTSINERQDNDFKRKKDGSIASLTGKRISTTTFDVSKPSETTAEGQKLHGPKRGEYKSTGSTSDADGKVPFQQPRVLAI